MNNKILNRASRIEWPSRIGRALIVTGALLGTLVYAGGGPTEAHAANYYMKADNTTSLGIDGSCDLPAGAPSTKTTYPAHTTMGTAEDGTASRYYPAGVPQSVMTVVARLYGPVYAANAVDISAISASAGMRVYNTGDQFQIDLYDYDPAGTAGNKTLVASGTAKTVATGAVTQVTWTAGDFTISGTGRVALNHRLLVEISFFRNGATTTSPRIYFGASGATSSTNITVTETPVSAVVTPTVTTPTAMSITNITATLGANVTADGGAALTARGTVWGTTAAPTGNAAAEGGTTTGVFTHGRTALTAATRIYYRGYATNSAGTSYSPDGSFYTEPTTQVSAVSFASVTTTSMTINWTRGTGNGVIVLMRAGFAVNSDPVDGTYTGYTGNPAFGSGTQIGTGNYIVYKGTGTSAAITGLSASTTYYVAAYEYAGTADTSGYAQGTNYKPTAATGSQATSAGGGPAAPTGITISNMTSGGPLVSWNTVGGAVSYNVYRSTDGSNWGSTIGGVGAPTTSYADNAAPKSNTLYYWTVTAVNGSESTKPAGVSGRTALYNGYNMVSAPYNTSGQVPVAAFGVWANWAWNWNSSSNVDPDNSGIWVTPLEVTPGKGMFLWAYDGTTVLSATGSVNSASLAVTLVPGWNMISNQAPANMSNIGANWMVDGSTPLTTAVSNSTINGALSWWDGVQYQTLLISGNPVIEPWKAYFILNQTGVNHTLTIQ